MVNKSVIVTQVELRKKPGHLYFIDGDGDIANRKANPGHTPSGPLGVNHPNRKVLKLGIKKQRGWMYYLERVNRKDPSDPRHYVRSQPMRQFVRRNRSKTTKKS